MNSSFFQGDYRSDYLLDFGATILSPCTYHQCWNTNSRFATNNIIVFVFDE